jgi:hypothetical protein
MGLVLALKAFWKAWKEPQKGEQFLEDRLTPALTKPVEEIKEVSHLRLLSYLQQSGRLIDFLKEDISAFNDAQVGAAVRKIHQDCAQLLEDLVTIRPLKTEQEGAPVQIPKGYNPMEIKVVGKVKGEPPFSGTLVHRGWKAHKRSLPKQIADFTTDVICPAEVEVK